MGRRPLYGEAQAYAEHVRKFVDSDLEIQVQFVKVIIDSMFKAAKLIAGAR